MVDLGLLTLDTSAIVVALLLPGAAWALLFYLAWERPRFAESVGLGRRAFWLLLPGALLASYAILPLAPISIDWIAIDLSGALFPLLVGAFALARYAPPLRRSAPALLLALVGEAAVLLAIAWPSVLPAWSRLGGSVGLAGETVVDLAVATAAATAVAVVFVASRRPAPVVDRPVALLVGLASGALVLTFVGSSAIPGVGIEESFPYYLCPPILLGVVAGVVAPLAFPRTEGFALPAAYLAATVGVLLGADLLRQPPLYGSGPPGLYAIGGAGVLDLVYLSGLLALGSATIVHWAAGRGWAPVGVPLPAGPPSPFARLRDGFRAGVAGDLSGSLAASVAAARAAAERARTLLGVAPPPADRPWEGLPVPGWVVSDHANLEAVARAGTTDPREGYRGWLTARGLVTIAHDVAARRFASIAARLAAFGVDLAVVFGPALLVFAGIAAATRGGVLDVLGSLAYNAAIVGFVAAAVLYFAAAETLGGRTVGKALLGIRVVTPRLDRPDGLSALVRNAPLAPVLTVLAIGGGLATAISLKGPNGAGLSFGGVAIPSAFLTDLGIAAFVGGGLVLLGLVGVLAMALSADRQRVGDLWAGTWVLRAVRAGPPPGAAAPPAADRSG